MNIPNIEFAKELDEATIMSSVGECSDISENHIVVLLSSLEAGYLVGDIADDTPAIPLTALTFYREESIDCLIETLESARLMLSMERGMSGEDE